MFTVGLTTLIFSFLKQLRFTRAGKRTIMYVTNLKPNMDTSELGPMKNVLKSASRELELLKDEENKHWMSKGKRSLGIAANLLLQHEIIAVPTDTVYGLAGIASDSISIQKLYEIKGRDENKPLCISVGSIKDINHWAYIDHLPTKLFSHILPGPYTIILKRSPHLNPYLNPGFDTVGVRVPQMKFLYNLPKIVGPLALTSANLSNEPSCLKATEFKELWPQLGGIFYTKQAEAIQNNEKLRKGSTIVDLSNPGYYKIVRFGVGAEYLIQYLNKLRLEPIDH